jgi:2-oxoglutarate ferredoxin oxidoreductase subunit alpha
MPTRTQQADLLSAAYASHGDTKNVLLIPANPAECFAMMNTAFDLAEHLQTPVIMMTDLDLGMNDHLSQPFDIANNKPYNRGKVLNAEQLDALPTWGRYLDLDGDGIPYRTIPGTHPSKGSYFTRGTSHDEYANYTEDADTYVRIMERLVRKFDTAKKMVPEPIFYQEVDEHDIALLFFGTSTYAAEEAVDLLKQQGIMVDAIRLRAFPFDESVDNFIKNHKKVFVIEQNRDAQMRSLLVNELDINPKKLIKVLNYDGTPITAQHICNVVASEVNSFKLQNN